MGLLKEPIGKKGVIAQEPAQIGGGKFLMFLFAVGVFLLPFDFITGLPYFGEFSKMASFYVFFPLVLFNLPRLVTKGRDSYVANELLYFIIFMSLSIAISFSLNLSHVLGDELKFRSGLNKALTTTTAFYFCVFLSLTTAKFAKTPSFIAKAIVKPTLAVFWFVVLPVSLIELMSWILPAVEGTYIVLTDYVRDSDIRTTIGAVDGKLRGVSGEPSFYALYLGFAFVCFSYSKQNFLKKSRSFWSRLAFILVLSCIVLTGTRTSVLLLCAFLAMFIYQRIFLRIKSGQKRLPKSSILWTSGFLFLFALLVFLGRSDAMAKLILQGESVSNLSRYASNYTALSLFIENPLFGVGFGQYAFRAINALPLWAWNSKEIVQWFTDPYRSWPAVFSTPSRLAAELGMVGVLAWYFPLIHLLRRLFSVAQQEYARLGKIPKLGSSLLYGMIYVLVYGLGQEGFRQFGAWIIIGIVSAYVKTAEPEDYYDVTCLSKNSCEEGRTR